MTSRMVRCRSVRPAADPWDPGWGPGVFVLSLIAANLVPFEPEIKHVFDRVAIAQWSGCDPPSRHGATGVLFVGGRT